MVDEPEAALLVRQVPIMEDRAISWLRPMPRRDPGTMPPGAPPATAGRAKTAAAVRIFVLSDAVPEIEDDPAAVLVVTVDDAAGTAVVRSLVTRDDARDGSGVDVGEGSLVRRWCARLLADTIDLLRADGVGRLLISPTTPLAGTVGVLPPAGFHLRDDGWWVLDL